MSSNPVVPFRGPSGSAADAKAAKDYAGAAADRQERQFKWARRVLEQLGLADRIKNARNFDELRKIVFDEGAVGMMQAIQDKLHPASGPKDPDFIGFKEGGLKRLLRNQFDDMKKGPGERAEEAARRCRCRQRKPTLLRLDRRPEVRRKRSRSSGVGK